MQKKQIIQKEKEVNKEVLEKHYLARDFYKWLAEKEKDEKRAAEYRKKADQIEAMHIELVENYLKFLDTL